MALAPHQAAVRPNVSWMAPDHHCIKINVDDSFSSASNGIGGAFKDHFETFLLHFSKQVEADSAVHIEVFAIREALLIATTSR